MNLCEGITLSAELASLHVAQAFVCSHATAMGLEAEDIAKVELAVEEALINIIKHGYCGCEGSVEITCAPCSASKGIAITIKDAGPPFDPSKDPKNGEGRGLMLIRACVDRVAYHREGERNVLVLQKIM